MIMALHGIGTLLPWNMFITANAVSLLHIYNLVLSDFICVLFKIYKHDSNLMNQKNLCTGLMILPYP